MAAPRIRPLPSDSEAVQAVGPLAARGAKGIGFMSTVLHNQNLYDVWRPLARYLNASTTLTLRDREIVILRTAWLSHSQYEWGNHALVVATGNVLSDQEMLGIRLGSSAPNWTPAEAALIAATEEYKASSAISEATWQTLSDTYSDEQLVELLVLIGFYWLIAFFASSVQIDLEEGLPSMYDYRALLTGVDHSDPASA